MASVTPKATSFSSVVDETLDYYYDANPVAARRLGLHAYDGRLPDVSRGGLQRRSGELEESIARLERVDPASLDEAEALDRQFLLARCRHELLRLREWKTWAKYPLDYLDLMDVSDYMRRDYAPRIDRAMALCIHLKGIPRLLDDARGNLEPELDRAIVETSIRLLHGYVDFVENDLGEAVADAHEGDDAFRRSLLQARKQAVEATNEFISVLEALSVTARPDAFPVGPDVFRKMLLYGEGVDVPLDRLLEIGERELARNRRALAELAERIDPSVSAREVMERVKREHPAAADLVAATQRIADDVRRFVVENDLVTIPSSRECVIEETPSYLSYAFAMMESPGPFEERDFPGIYYVTPPQPGWEENEVEDWLQEFSFAGLHNTTVHEAWPGHFLHDLHIRQCSSRVLRTHHVYSSFESWAHYSEEMMIEQGYAGDDLSVRVVQIGDALLRAVRFVASIRMHTRGMSVDEACRLFRQEAMLGETAARAEAERGTYDPGYVNYTLGKLMLVKLRNDWQAARGEGASIKEFHDTFLGWAAAPVPFVRQRMLPGDTGDIL
jgi:uncharacterized protein (DUF885 family)